MRLASARMHLFPALSATAAPQPSATALRQGTPAGASPPVAVGRLPACGQSHGTHLPAPPQIGLVRGGNYLTSDDAVGGRDGPSACHVLSVAALRCPRSPWRGPPRGLSSVALAAQPHLQPVTARLWTPPPPCRSALYKRHAPRRLGAAGDAHPRRPAGAHARPRGAPPAALRVGRHQQVRRCDVVCRPPASRQQANSEPVTAAPTAPADSGAAESPAPQWSKPVRYYPVQVLCLLLSFHGRAPDVRCAQHGRRGGAGLLRQPQGGCWRRRRVGVVRISARAWRESSAMAWCRRRCPRHPAPSAAAPAHGRAHTARRASRA